MSFPSSTGTRQDSLASAWERARSLAAQIKGAAVSLRARLAASPASAGLVLDAASSLIDARSGLTRASATTGIVAYAQAQIAEGGLDVAAEFATMMAKIDAVLSWIAANFPKDGNGFLLYASFVGATAEVQFRQLTVAQTAGLRVVLDDLIASID